MFDMKVLIGCEFSGTVRDAFASRGHDVMSCDLLPTESDGPHFAGNIFDVIDYPWDLAIFHPPCTHLAVSGAHRFVAKRRDGRQQSAMAFVMALIRRSEHIPKVAVENPVSVISSLWRKPDQVIQPWMFGDPESKATCLWLKGLPKLTPTDIKSPPPRWCLGEPNIKRSKQAPAQQRPLETPQQNLSGNRVSNGRPMERFTPDTFLKS